MDLDWHFAETFVEGVPVDSAEVTEAGMEATCEGARVPSFRCEDLWIVRVSNFFCIFCNFFLPSSVCFKDMVMCSGIVGSSYSCYQQGMCNEPRLATLHILTRECWGRFSLSG